jgi:hypothetical protein
VVGFAFALGQLGEGYGFVDGLLPGGQAFGAQSEDAGFEVVGATEALEGADGREGLDE